MDKETFINEIIANDGYCGRGSYINLTKKQLGQFYDFCVKRLHIYVDIDDYNEIFFDFRHILINNPGTMEEFTDELKTTIAYNGDSGEALYCKNGEMLCQLQLTDDFTFINFFTRREVSEEEAKRILAKCNAYYDGYVVDTQSFILDIKTNGGINIRE